MLLINQIKKRFDDLEAKTDRFLKKIDIPGGAGISLYTLAHHFRSGVFSSRLTFKASAISFMLFVAIFPGVIFLFTIIPYIPVDNFQSILMTLLQDLLPDDIFPLVERTILDILNIKHSGLLSIGFIMALYFSSSGFSSLISSFDQSINVTETRKGYQQRLISILLMLITTVIIIVLISMMAIGHDTLEWLNRKGYMQIHGTYNYLFVVRWFVLATIIYLTISIIYYVAPARRAGFRFFSLGSLLATLFLILIAWGFGFFIKYFSSHNALYGSIGTLLLLLLYIYYNAITLLVGFELNASILVAMKNKKPKAQESLSEVV